MEKAIDGTEGSSTDFPARHHYLRGPSSATSRCGLGHERKRQLSAARCSLSPEQKGETIAAYDALIAGQCLSRNFTLVSGNVSEFRRVKGLRLENWMK